MLITLIISLIMITTIFVTIVNSEYLEVTKRNLRENNNILINILKVQTNGSNYIKLENIYKNSEFRVTVIDRSGNVLYDSRIDLEQLDNHNKRQEIVEARQKGEGSSIRYSDSTKSNMMYVATLYGDSYIVRSSVPLRKILGFEGKYLVYYIIAMLIVILMTGLFSSKLSNRIVKPINDLQYITSKVALGELDNRVNIVSNDEIGQLGVTFNHMAEKLQLTLKDSTDKQTSLEAILKSMDSGVIAVDKSYKVIMINPYAKEMFGINKDIIGQNFMDNIRDFEFENIFKNRAEEYSEIKILWPKERNLRIKTADLISNGLEIGTVAVVQDVTTIKKLENMRSQFVANVSHELKTPLTSIKGFAETLRYVQDDATKIKFLDIINDEADRLTRLINDILTLSDIENTSEAKNEKIDVNKVISNVFELMKNYAASKKIDLVNNSVIVPNIIGDTDRFKQMLINLVDNAIKYSESGAKVTIGTDYKDDRCILWVQDTGVGISGEHISRLFERFYRVDKARSRNQGGTGLGLAIVKHIVMSFNGTISVESRIREGSKFIVEIPIKE